MIVTVLLGESGIENESSDNESEGCGIESESDGSINHTSSLSSLLSSQSCRITRSSKSWSSP